MGGLKKSRRRRRIALAASIAIALLCAGAYAVLQRAGALEPQRVRLSDGTVALFYSGSELKPAAGFPHPRVLAMDGDLFLQITASDAPMTVTSRLLRLTIPGACEFRITAYSHQTGEQVQVLSGELTAYKNYPSTYSEPDHLAAGEMSMVNQTIDLMEKETFQPHEVTDWVAGFNRR